ncbi:MAG: hypothetical protein GY820_39435 [Gammaproteobacteria bacterium]|nr:hypothetical protein [Gammaproteobacteria bacterium]
MSNEAIELLREIRDELRKTNALLLAVQPAVQDLSSGVSNFVSKPVPVVSIVEGGGGGGVGSKACRKGRNDKNQYSQEFLQFWTVYPRREGKGRAWKYWTREGLDRKLPDILSGVALYRCTEGWQKDGGRFIPHPATWLNDRRWEDEPETAAVARPTVCLVDGVERKWGTEFSSNGDVFTLKEANGHRGLWKKDPAATGGWYFVRGIA